jgi:hypothetical protein
LNPPRKIWIFSSSLILATIFFSALFIYINFIKRTEGFSLKKIVSYHHYHPKWDTGPITDKQKLLLDQISSQPFFYLGSGKECYAFVSQDDQFVIKFFKQKHMHARSIFTIWPFNKIPYLSTVNKGKIAKHLYLRHQTFMSYLIAYSYFPDRTGVLYLHLNKSHNLKKRLTLYSPKGIPFKLDLDSTEFLIQKRADLVFSYLSRLLQEHNLAKAKQAIGSILDLIITRSRHGIVNSDNNCEKNMGFIDGRATFIDIGELRLAPPSYPSQKEFELVTQDLKKWLRSHNSELLDFLDKQIQKRVDPVNLSE